MNIKPKTVQELALDYYFNGIQYLQGELEQRIYVYSVYQKKLHEIKDIINEKFPQEDTKDIDDLIELYKRKSKNNLASNILNSRSWALHGIPKK